jgi:hypothetical protein
MTMNMRDDVRLFNFMKRGSSFTKFSDWSKEVGFGSANGSADIKKKAQMVSKTKVVPPRRSGEKLLNV